MALADTARDISISKNYEMRVKKEVNKFRLDYRLEMLKEIKQNFIIVAQSISISIEPNTELLQAAKPLKLG
jgi:hypothetical protein